MKEADVQKWVKESLEKEFKSKLYIFKVPQSQYISRKGIPDLIMSIKGRFVGIEVKMPAGRVTKLQQHEIDLINKSGGDAFTIYGKDEVMLQTFIRRLREEYGI